MQSQTDITCMCSVAVVLFYQTQHTPDVSKSISREFQNQFRCQCIIRSVASSICVVVWILAISDCKWMHSSSMWFTQRQYVRICVCVCVCVYVRFKFVIRSRHFNEILSLAFLFINLLSHMWLWSMCMCVCVPASVCVSQQSPNKL